jgi:hypothetical protein
MQTGHYRASPVEVIGEYMILIMRLSKAPTMHFINYDGMLVCNMLCYLFLPVLCCCYFFKYEWRIMNAPYQKLWWYARMQYALLPVLPDTLLYVVPFSIIHQVYWQQREESKRSCSWGLLKWASKIRVERKQLLVWTSHAAFKGADVYCWPGASARCVHLIHPYLRLFWGDK